jgi:flagellar biosynthesis/type III secretory pathway protein FliH
MALPRHPYEKCRDTNCERPACRAWKEALEEGYQEGRKDGYAEGYPIGHKDGWNEGFPAGMAACPLAHE